MMVCEDKASLYALRSREDYHTKMLQTIKKICMEQIATYDADAQALELRTLIYYGYQCKDLLRSCICRTR